MKRFLAVLLVSLAHLHTCGAQTPGGNINLGGFVVGSAYGNWTIPVSTGNVSIGTQTLVLGSSSISLSSGRTVVPFATNAPLLVDSGTSQETVTPSAIVGCNVGAGIGSCQITATFTKAHGRGALIQSATFGLQEAINDMNLIGSGTVLVDQTFKGSTSNITSAVGYSKVEILDQRSSPSIVYAWTGSVYAIVTAGGATIGATTNVLKGDGVGGGLASSIVDNGATVVTAEPITAPSFTGKVAITSGGLSGRSDFYDGVADGGLVGNNSATCIYNNFAGCVDEHTLLQSVITNHSTGATGKGLFLPHKSTQANGCDYYSSTQLNLPSGSYIQGAASTQSGGTSICFASGVSGLVAGSNISAIHLDGLRLYGGDAWDNTNIATYVLAASYGGAGANADGVVIPGQSTISNMEVQNFARHCFTWDSGQTNGSDATIATNLFAGGCRGDGYNFTGSDVQVGTMGNLTASANMLYGVRMKGFASYGNNIQINTRANHHVSGNMPTAMAGTFAFSCVAPTAVQVSGTCTVTESSANTMYVGDRVTFAGMTDSGLNGPRFILLTVPDTTHFTFAYNVTESLATNGSANYNAGYRVFAAAGTNGNGGNYGHPGPGSNLYLGCYSESTDEMGTFTDAVTYDMCINPQGSVPQDGLVLSSWYNHFLMPALIVHSDTIGAPLTLRLNGGVTDNYNYAAEVLYNTKPGGNLFGTVNSVLNRGSRRAWGNVSSWWGDGMPGNQGANLIQSSIAYPDALTMYSLNGTPTAARNPLFPNSGFFVGHGGGGVTDGAVSTTNISQVIFDQAAAPVSCNAGDIFFKRAPTGAGDFVGWECLSANTPTAFGPLGSISGNTGVLATLSGSTTTNDCVKFDANGNIVDTGSPCGTSGGITALTGPVTASGTGSVAATITATGVTAGSYTNASVTFNAAGQATAASSGAAGLADPGGNGIVKRTGLGVSAVAGFADTVGQWSGCTSGYLKYDGTCSSTTATAATQRGVDAVVDLLLDGTGATDNSAKLQTYIQSTCPAAGCEIYFPCGSFLFTTGVVITRDVPFALIGSGTSVHTGGSGATGSGGCTRFTTASGINIFWLNFTGITSMEQGPRIEHIQFVDSSGANAISGLRFTNAQNWYLNDLTFTNFKGKSLTTGTVNVANNSRQVTGAGFTSAMNGGQLMVAGYPHEVNSDPVDQGIGTSTGSTIFLTDLYQDSSNAAATYELDYGGYGLLLDPGNNKNPNFNQYAIAFNIKAYDTRYPIYMYGGVGPNWGNSRIKFLGSFLNCHRVPNSIGVFMGGYSDTMDIGISENLCTFGAVMENAHENTIRASNFENGSSNFPPNTTCGGSPSLACTKGVLIGGSSTTHNQRNEVSSSEFNQYGNAIELRNQAEQTMLMHNNYGSNTNDISEPAAGNPGNDTTSIYEYAGVKINGVATSEVQVGKVELMGGSGAPAGSCNNGSMYVDTNPAAGGGYLYVCQSSAWVKKL